MLEARRAAVSRLYVAQDMRGVSLNGAHLRAHGETAGAQWDTQHEHRNHGREVRLQNGKSCCGYAANTFVPNETA
ncbi:hypothetical protein GCM10007884_35790 [Methylobacterium brachythecii]|uniref:Uncharacterized protein n=1 Tax=Methylobacterium brachythecii TaxID=1176177 RepID=A0ABQ6D7Q6_9HYPH|nr:hypothetical protein GCM10007884_35790 [Methylobacterium brachythecii]